MRNVQGLTKRVVYELQYVKKSSNYYLRCSKFSLGLTSYYS